jgi:Peptidase M15
VSGVITLAQYFMGRDAEHAPELTETIRRNAELTVARVNALLAHACIECAVNSGWRPAAINAAVPGASPRSRHLTCEAVDLDDPDDALDTWCMAHLDVLEAIGLWLEHPAATPGWCHVQIVPPRSGRRVFEP